MKYLYVNGCSFTWGGGFESEFPDVPVISSQEVVPEIRIQPLGRIRLP